MIRRRHRYAAALAALAAVLFAQAAFALALCDAARMPSRAEVLVQGEEHATCHEPAQSLNLCFAHCQNAEQTLDKHQVKPPVFAPVAVLELRGAQHTARPLAWEPRVPSVAAGPPPRILFRSLLI